MSLTKTKPLRSKSYLAWVRSLPCAITFTPNTPEQPNIAHHIIGKGFGGWGTKAPDYLTMPVTASEHSLIFHCAVTDQIDLDKQFKWITDILKKALKLNIITIADDAEFATDFMMAIDDEDFCKQIDDLFNSKCLKIDKTRIKHILIHGD